MPTFIALLDYTDQGVQNLRESPQRADAFNEFAEKAGGQGAEWRHAEKREGVNRQHSRPMGRRRCLLKEGAADVVEDRVGDAP